jgi:hypothetical protein
MQNWTPDEKRGDESAIYHRPSRLGEPINGIYCDFLGKVKGFDAIILGVAGVKFPTTGKMILNSGLFPNKAVVGFPTVPQRPLGVSEEQAAAGAAQYRNQKNRASGVPIPRAALRMTGQPPGTVIRRTAPRQPVGYRHRTVREAGRKNRLNLRTMQGQCIGAFLAQG